MKRKGKVREQMEMLLSMIIVGHENEREGKLPPIGRPLHGCVSCYEKALEIRALLVERKRRGK